MTDHLLISVVTATLNRAQFLREAIESVLAQSYPEIEHIVVDGGSTDGTLDILKEYPGIRWISEPDGGMYEAVNKGIRMARGDVVGLLNSDDAYVSQVFPAVSQMFHEDQELAAIMGGATIYRNSLHSSQTLRVNELIEWADEKKRWERLTGRMVTNAWFFRRWLFDHVGFFDESYRVAADRDFLLRVGFSGLKVSSLPQQVYCYRYHASSLTMNPRSSLEPKRAAERMRTLREGMHIAEKYLLSSDSPETVRPYLRRWHSQRAYALAMTAFFQFDWKAAAHAVRMGLKFDPHWSFIFMNSGFKRFMKLLKRK